MQTLGGWVKYDQINVCANLTLVHLLSLVKGQNVSLQGVRSGISFLTQVALELLYCGNKKTHDDFVNFTLLFSCSFAWVFRLPLEVNWAPQSEHEYGLSLRLLFIIIIIAPEMRNNSVKKGCSNVLTRCALFDEQ